MAEGGQFPLISRIDRPGPVAVAGAGTSVQGWVAGPVPVREVALLINDIGVEIFPEGTRLTT